MFYILSLFFCAIVGARELKQTFVSSLNQDQQFAVFNPSGSIQFGNIESSDQGFEDGSAFFKGNQTFVFQTDTSVPQVNQDTDRFAALQTVEGYALAPGSATAVNGSSYLRFDKEEGVGATFAEGGGVSRTEGFAPGGSGLGFTTAVNLATQDDGVQQVISDGVAESATTDGTSQSASSVRGFGGSVADGGSGPVLNALRSNIFSATTEDTASAGCEFLASSSGGSGASQSNCAGTLVSGAVPAP